MLGGVDRALELAGWALALMLVIMMFVGPQVVAEDKPADQGGESAGSAPYGDQAEADDGGGAATEGETVFTDKRPFFTENQGVFDLRTPANGQLIYTRRIGVLEETLLHSPFTLAEGRLVYEIANRDHPSAQEICALSGTSNV